VQREKETQNNYTCCWRLERFLLRSLLQQQLRTIKGVYQIAGALFTPLAEIPDTRLTNRDSAAIDTLSLSATLGPKLHYAPLK